ncbi:fatty acyl-AMP ligase [Roseomonas marmotae]|uniref:Fatty acyl-AMP ligase n=1 Tax=Roseomonas marmotae TaxID=2768161 RepID=A0ABS3KEG4_9PROT|nr:fatty acyl-AMP ligase [Roseomonas marmotae]MBO1075877.1 fatty acyl-AMP ligase [Roseomonas marmotae]QTI81935.1 fatty acyl-AMP ligase [Roseomonas marmotae]
MPLPIPTLSGLPLRRGDFATLPEALDYAAGGATGIAFHSIRGGHVASLTYRDLREQALDLAGRLLGAGLRRGERVAMLADTSPDFVCAFFASQYAGLVPAPLPLPPPFGGREAYVAQVERLLQEAHAAALFVPGEIMPWLAPVAGRMGLKFFGTVEQMRGVQPAAAAPVASGPDDIAYLQFSSGSTRHPTGVAVRQRAVMANTSGIMQHGLKMRLGDRTASWLPFYHDMGLVGFLLTPIAGQLSIDAMPTSDFARRPMMWLSILSEYKGTLSFSPSFGYELCVRRRASAPEGLDLSSWRVAGLGGDMIRPHVLEAFAEGFAPHGFRREALVPSYGMAEATLAISFAELEQGFETDEIDLTRLETEGRAVPATAQTERRRPFVLCGKVLPEHELEVRDSAGRILPDRQVGSIRVRGPSIMQGYDGQPERTAEVLSEDGWLDTGDLGYMLDGQVVITGRAKDVILVKGRNIWPQDLEWSVEHALPNLRTGDVAAFSVDEEGEETVVLLVEARGAPDATARERLIAEVGGVLRARHGLEGRVVLVPPGALVQTSSGKLSRAWSRRKYLAGEFGPVPSASQQVA